MRKTITSLLSILVFALVFLSFRVVARTPNRDVVVGPSPLFERSLKMAIQDLENPSNKALRYQQAQKNINKTEGWMLAYNGTPTMDYTCAGCTTPTTDYTCASCPGATTDVTCVGTGTCFDTCTGPTCYTTTCTGSSTCAPVCDDQDDDDDSNGIPDDQEVDDTVDLDENGIPDIDQDDIECVNTVVGDGQIGVKGGTNVTSIDSLMSIDPGTIADTANKPEEMPLGLISFELTDDSAGDTAQVTVYLSDPAPADAKWYKYDVINGWQDYSDHATFSADRTSVTLELKDGGFGDADGTANGVIVDPSGLGTAPTTHEPTPTPDDSGTDGCFIATAAAYGSLMEPHVKMLCEFRDRILLTNSLGKSFVEFYDTYCSPIADFIAGHDRVRYMMRWGLLPLVGVSWMALELGLIATSASMLLLLTLIAAIEIVLFRKRRLRRQET